jgi:hypothetical protein
VSLRQRVPYVIALWAGAVLMCFLALLAYRERLWPEALVYGGVGAAQGVACAVLAVRTPRRDVPDWSRRYELVGVPGEGLVMRCNRCDAIVLPSVRSLTAARFLTYAHLHTFTVCGRGVPEPGQDTARLVESRRGWLSGRRRG